MRVNADNIIWKLFFSVEFIFFFRILFQNILKNTFYSCPFGLIGFNLHNNKISSAKFGISRIRYESHRSKIIYSYFCLNCMQFFLLTSFSSEPFTILHQTNSFHYFKFIQIRIIFSAILTWVIDQQTFDSIPGEYAYTCFRLSIITRKSFIPFSCDI